MHSHGRESDLVSNLVCCKYVKFPRGQFAWWNEPLFFLYVELLCQAGFDLHIAVSSAVD